jgi:hypothetical protein
LLGNGGVQLGCCASSKLSLLASTRTGGFEFVITRGPDVDGATDEHVE